MFYVLRIMSEERHKRQVSGSALSSAFASALAYIQRMPELVGVLSDASASRVASGTMFPTMDPLAVPDRWFDPNHTSAEIGSSANGVGARYTAGVSQYKTLMLCRASSASSCPAVACRHG